jgi:hypothetical protein
LWQANAQSAAPILVSWKNNGGLPVIIPKELILENGCGIGLRDCACTVVGTLLAQNELLTPLCCALKKTLGKEAECSFGGASEANRAADPED